MGSVGDKTKEDSLSSVGVEFGVFLTWWMDPNTATKEGIEVFEVVSTSSS